MRYASPTILVVTSCAAFLMLTSPPSRVAMLDTSDAVTLYFVPTQIFVSALSPRLLFQNHCTRLLVAFKGIFSRVLIARRIRERAVDDVFLRAAARALC